MSQRHTEAFRAIRREYDDVVAVLTQARRGRRRGAPGIPAFDPKRLDAAIATVGDAYALLLIAIAEGFLHEYLQSIGIRVGDNWALGPLIVKSFAEWNKRSTGMHLPTAHKQPMHELRVSRNRYAHGQGISAFRSVGHVESTVSRFLGPCV
jgi:hypothetical protein